MGAVWFAILTVMLTTYAVLDGFDFGVGILHLFVAKTDEERRRVFAAIEPVWDGNEVWLVAAGGSLFFAFPQVYAAAFSGLYLPLMIVLWLLILRGISIKVRSQVDDPLWRAAWDATFAFASASMAFVLGVTIGNVVRGVPLDASGYFEEDLFSITGTRVAAVDLYTALLGTFALVTLGGHGATYLALKTEGELAKRARALGAYLWAASLGLAVAASVATALTQAAFFEHALARPWIWPLPALAVASGVVARSALAKGRELPAFAASCTFIASLLFATAGALFPWMLRSTVGDAFTLGVASATSRGLGRAALVWALAMTLVLAYLTYVLRSFRGKVDAHHG